GMSQVKANRVITVRSEQERRAAPLDANTNKITEGKSNGWSLVYCKGPDGEQLELVQDLEPVKKTFQDALETRRRMLAAGRGRRDIDQARKREEESAMIKQMGPLVPLSALAGLAYFAGSTSVMAQDGPGKGYSQVPQGAYSVVADVRAKPGKEIELRAAT